MQPAPTSTPNAKDKNKNKSLEEVLDDLSARFIINLPNEELESFERLCFQIEQAHWFYLDYCREEHTKLPLFNFKEFTKQMFHHCPILQPYRSSVDQILTNFTHYKVRVPACGAIILNPSFDKCLLVKGWTNRSSWGFPKGKINKDELESDCAIREVFEETSFNIGPYLKEEDHIELILRETEQRVKLFIIAGIPEDTVFIPRTRKEISKISWFPISEFPTDKATLAGGKDAKGILPIPTTPISVSPNPSGSGVATANKSRNYFMVTPFISKLKSWLKRKKHLRKLPPTSDPHAIVTVYDNSTTNPIPTSPIPTPSHPSTTSLPTIPAPIPMSTPISTSQAPALTYGHIPPAPETPTKSGFVPLAEPISLMHLLTPPGPPRHASFTNAHETPSYPTPTSHKPLPQIPVPSPFHYPPQSHMSPPPHPYMYPSTPPQVQHHPHLHQTPQTPSFAPPPNTPSFAPPLQHTPPHTPSGYHTPATTPPPRSHPPTPYTPYPVSPPVSPTRTPVQSTPPLNWQLTPQKDKHNHEVEHKRNTKQMNKSGNAFVNFKFDVEEIMKSFAQL